MNFQMIHEGERKLKKLLTGILILAMLISLAGCNKKDVDVYYESLDKEWSMEIPKEYKKDKEETKDGFYHISYKNENSGLFSITEILDEDTTVDEENLEADLGEDSYLHIVRKETLDVAGIGKIYGLLIEDHSTGGHMLYYKLRINDKIVNILTYKKQPFTLEEEAKIKSMIGNIKILK